MNPLRNATNRLLLGLVAAVLLVLGSWLAATAASLSTRLPSWWPTPPPGSVLLDRDGLNTLRTHEWWTPVMLITTAIVMTLFAGWCIAQLRTGGRRLLPLSPPSVTLHSRALAEAIARRASMTPGVTHARVTLRGGPKVLRARLRVHLEPGTEPRTALAQLAATLTEASDAIAPRELRTNVRIGVHARQGQRLR